METEDLSRSQIKFNAMIRLKTLGQLSVISIKSVSVKMCVLKGYLIAAAGSDNHGLSMSSIYFNTPGTDKWKQMKTPKNTCTHLLTAPIDFFVD